MKVYRHIALLLLISFSAFLGHNLVPHHHHTEALLNPIATDCPIQHEEHTSCDQDAEGVNHHPDEHPVHCHAFNDVVFGTHQTQVFMPLSGYAMVLAPSYADLIPDPTVNTNFYRFNYLKIPFKGIDLYGSRGLRGPPPAA
jgi:hypothetical protein